MSFEKQLCEHFFSDIESNPDRSKRIRLRNLKEKFTKAFKGYDFSNVVLNTLDSNCIAGLTHDGLNFNWYVNSGYNERSLHCGRLLIDGKCVFTSGSISKVIPHIAKLEIKNPVS